MTVLDNQMLMSKISAIQNVSLLALINKKSYRIGKMCQRKLFDRSNAIFSRP